MTSLEHAIEMQVSLSHSMPGSQFPAVRHSTHSPVPSQSFVPPAPHLVPGSSLTKPHALLTQLE
jgi:hypothetical protein